MYSLVIIKVEKIQNCVLVTNTRRRSERGMNELRGLELERMSVQDGLF